jgi:hypothetical protein
VNSRAPVRSRIATTSSTSPIGRVAVAVEAGEALAVLGAGVLERVDHRQRLLVAGDVGRLLAGRLLGAPDAQRSSLSWNAIPQRPAERPVAPDDLFVVGRQERAGLDRGGDQRRGLAADHVEVQLDRHQLVRLARRDVDVLALAQRDARLVVEAHQPEDLRVAEAQLREPVERDPRQAEQHVAGVDRLGDAVHCPQGRPVAALEVAVLDVVVTRLKLWPSSTAAAPGVPPRSRRRSRCRRAGPAAAGSACRSGRRRGRAPGGSGSSRRRPRWRARRARRRPGGSRPPCRRISACRSSSFDTAVIAASVAGSEQTCEP